MNLTLIEAHLGAALAQCVSIRANTVVKNKLKLNECQSKRRQTETSTDKNVRPKSECRQQKFPPITLTHNVDTFLQS